MSDDVVRERRKALDRPTRHEILTRLRQRPRRTLRPKPTDVLRSEREKR